MKKLMLLGLAVLVTPVLAQTVPPTSGPAANGSPAWSYKPSFPDPTGHTLVAPDGTVTVARPTGPSPIRATDDVPGCQGSIVCGRRGGFPRGQMMRVFWNPMPGWTPDYSYNLPRGLGGLPSVGLDSKGNLWAFQRRAPGEAQLMKFDANKKLVLSVGDDVITHRSKAHGLAVDAQDNVWITDAGMSTVQKLSPDGKLLLTIGTNGKRGDWDEAKGQRLLWQPMDIAFAPNGDFYIGEGHANESPNDVESGDPANMVGAARVLHFNRNGDFINQWHGNSVGQGKFSMAHGVAVDPRNGDVWIGDREEYRLVVYTADGQFIKTIQTRNLTCNIAFDKAGELWLGTGQDGQIVKIDRSGKVLGALGNGRGAGIGQVGETGYITWDSKGNIYTGSTGQDRVTMWVKP